MNAKPRACTCAAYRWPHRPGGGLCRWPDPPAETCPTPAGTNRPKELRRRGARKSIMAMYRLHPIRDREKIARFMPRLYEAFWDQSIDDYEIEAEMASVDRRATHDPSTEGTTP